MDPTGHLQRTLTFSDLLGFGISSIMGSGGFNLISEGVKEGGPNFPWAIGIVAALFQGASKIYSEAYSAFKSNTSESDVVRQEFGTVAQAGTALAITAFNIASVSTILVFSSKMMFPRGAWYGQISIALAILTGMSLFSLKGIKVNTQVITSFSAVIVGLLAFASAIGLIEGFGPTGTPPNAYPSEFNQTRNFAQSVNYFYFVLAGFDALMKFVGESKSPDEDIPKAFYVSNALSTLLTIGVSYAYVHTMTLKKTGGESSHNAIGLIIEKALGKPSGSIVFYLSLFLMIVTAFVCYLATTRYLYGLAEEDTPIQHLIAPLKDLNDEKVPWKSVLVCTIIAALGILVNHVGILVNMSDMFLTLVMIIVSAAVGVMRMRQGKQPWIEFGTAIGFFTILRTCCFP